jgi:hypothetical protein
VLINYPTAVEMHLDCALARYSARKALWYDTLSSSDHFPVIRSAVGQVYADASATEICVFINDDVAYTHEVRRQLDAAYAARTGTRYTVEPLRAVGSRFVEENLRDWLPNPYRLESIPSLAFSRFQQKPVLCVFPEPREYGVALAAAFGFPSDALDLNSCRRDHERKAFLSECRAEDYGGLVYVRGRLGELPVRNQLEFKGRLRQQRKLAHALGRLRSEIVK